MIDKIGIFIDGGYMANILDQYFGRSSIDYEKFAQWVAGDATILRVQYYDCLPYQSPSPSMDERTRLSKKQRFFDALNRLPRFEIRQGRLVFRGVDKNGHDIFEQKGVDLLLGLDLALLAIKQRIDRAALVSGDRDLLPAVQIVKREGVVVCLVHGPKGTYSDELWKEVDERKEITQNVIRTLLRNQIE